MQIPFSDSEQFLVKEHLLSSFKLYPSRHLIQEPFEISQYLYSLSSSFDMHFPSLKSKIKPILHSMHIPKSSFPLAQFSS